MARWRLTTSHYLNVPDTAWEQQEVDQATGRQLRKRYVVPQLLDVNDMVCWNYTTRNPRGEIVAGEIIVCHKGKGQPQDITFAGNPTPDMIPLDEEATAISKALEKKWNAKPDEERSFAQKLIEEQSAAAAELQAKQNTVKVDGMDQMLGALTQLAQQNQALIAALAGERRRA